MISCLRDESHRHPQRKKTHWSRLTQEPLQRNLPEPKRTYSGIKNRSNRHGKVEPRRLNSSLLTENPTCVTTLLQGEFGLTRPKCGRDRIDSGHPLTAGDVWARWKSTGRSEQSGGSLGKPPVCQ